MSYLRKRYGKTPYGRTTPVTALGGIVDDFLNAVQGASSAVATAASVATDPYLPEVICHVEQLHAIKSNQVPGACAKTPRGIPGGVGLSATVIPLRGYVYAQQHKWVYPAVIALTLGIPMLIGYELGRK